jgi:hypothetical protein
VTANHLITALGSIGGNVIIVVIHHYTIFAGGISMLQIQ